MPSCFNDLKQSTLRLGFLALFFSLSSPFGYAASARLSNALNAANQLPAQPQIQAISDNPPTGFRIPKVLLGQSAQWGTFQLVGRAYVCSFWPDHKVIVDADGDGTFDPEELARPTSALPIKGDATQRFPAVSFHLPGAPLDDAYLANLELRLVTSWTLQGTRTEWRAFLQSAARREGQIEAGGRTRRCAVQDANSNGRFDDPFRMADENPVGDRLFLDHNGDGDFTQEHESSYFGLFAAVGSQLFGVTVAPGGTALSLTAMPEAPGVLQTDESVSALEVAGPAGFLGVPAEKGRAYLPQGRWQLLRWTARQRWEGRSWQMMVAPRQPPQILVSNTPAVLKLLSPVVPVLDADRQNNGLRFTLNLATENGDVVLSLDAENVPGLFQSNFQLRLLDAQAHPWARLRLKPESGATYTQFWQPPAGAPARLGILPELDAGPFPIADLPPLDLILPTTETTP